MGGADRQSEKIWCPSLPEMVLTVSYSSRLYKVAPSPHKMSTCSKLGICWPWEGITYIFVNKFGTHHLRLAKSAHLHTCDFCIAHLRSRQKRPNSADWL